MTRIVVVVGERSASDRDDRRRHLLGMRVTLMSTSDLFRCLSVSCTDYRVDWSDNTRLALLAIGIELKEVPQPFNLSMEFR